MEPSSSSTALPLTLIALLAGGALYPHVAEFASQGSTPQAAATESTTRSKPGGTVVASKGSAQSGSRHAPAELPIAGLGSPAEDVTTAVDLLAEHYGLDISTERLRDIVKDAATRLGEHKDPPDAPTGLNRLPPPTDVLETFLDLDLHDYGLNPSLKCAREAVARLAGQPQDVKECAFRADIRTVRDFVKGYFDDEALRDDAAVVTQVKVKADRDIDQRRLRAKDFEQVDKTRLAEKLIKSWAGQDAVTFLIATVPDPLDSQEAWLFDPFAAVVRQGIEDSGFLFDRGFFPDTQAEPKSGPDDSGTRTQHEHWPGVVLFRAKPGTDGRRHPFAESDVLVAFLVYETPTAGIHIEAFQRAADFALDWSHEESTNAGKSSDLDRCAETSTPALRILGPIFSGSSPSLSLAIQNVLAVNSGIRTVRVISGAATNLTNKTVIEGSGKRVCFKATVLPNDVIDAAILSFLRTKGAGPIAKLVESGTSFGATSATLVTAASRDEEPPSIFLFPYGISKLRSDSAKEFRVAGASGQPVMARPLALEDLPAGSEQFPVATPSSTSPMVELSLTALLESIRREQFGAIGIAATDERDVLFLANKIRFYSPNTLLYANWDSLLFSHPDALASTAGLIEVSPYPMHQSAHHWPLPDGAWLSGDRRHMQFASMSVEGVYNAAIALLDYELDGSLATRFRGSGKLPPFPIDYVVKGSSSTPNVWINVASRGAAWPVDTYSIAGLGRNRLEASRGYVFYPCINDATLWQRKCVDDEVMQRLREAAAQDDHVFPSEMSRAIAAALILGTVALMVWSVWRRGAYSFARLRALSLASSGLLVASSATCFVWSRGAVMSGLDRWLGVLLGIGSFGLLGGVGFCSFSMWKSWSDRNEDSGSSWPWLVVGCLLIVCLGAAFLGLSSAHTAAMIAQRALDIGNGPSPLIPLLVFGAVPCLLAWCEFRRLKAAGDARETRSNPGKLWRDHGQKVLVSLTGGEASGGLGTAGDHIALIRASLFGLPSLGIGSVVVLTSLMCAAVFTGARSPIVSIEGNLFGFAVAVFLVLTQATLTVASMQHFYLWQACERVFGRMGWEPLRSAYQRLGLDGRIGTQDSLSRPVRLLDLQPLVDLEKDPSLGMFPVRSIDKTWTNDVKERKHWLGSDTWKNLSESVCAISDGFHHLPVTHRRPRAPEPLRHSVEYAVATTSVAIVSADESRADFAAIAAVVLMRDLLARLVQTRVLAGGCMLLLIALYMSFTFQASHSLLTVIWFDGLTLVALMIWVIVRMEQNEILSLTKNTKPGSLDWNVETVTKLFAYGVAPLIALLGAQFPQVAATLFRWFEPIQRLQ